MKNDEAPAYDLEERLLDYGATIIHLTRKLNGDCGERHVGKHLLRSGTAPLSHHGEAQGAESNADFIHKMKLAFKELRESQRWLKLIRKAQLLPTRNNSSHSSTKPTSSSASSSPASVPPKPAVNNLLHFSSIRSSMFNVPCSMFAYP